MTLRTTPRSVSPVSVTGWTAIVGKTVPNVRSIERNSRDCGPSTAPMMFETMTPPEKAFLQERWAEVRRQAPGAPDLEHAIDSRLERPIPTRDVPVLTDDYAPTDALLLLFG